VTIAALYVERMGKRERAATPPAFRDVLLEIARSVRAPAEARCAP
jgi:hypothetical protein